MSDRQFIIEPRGTEFLLKIAPPISGLFSSRVFETHSAARGHALGLRLSYGGEIIDRALEGRPHG